MRGLPPYERCDVLIDNKHISERLKEYVETTNSSFNGAIKGLIVHALKQWDGSSNRLKGHNDVRENSRLRRVDDSLNVFDIEGTQKALRKRKRHEARLRAEANKRSRKVRKERTSKAQEAKVKEASKAWRENNKPKLFC